MVRLLRKSADRHQESPAEFQSHNGAIAAAAFNALFADALCFNPTMVRLLLVSLISIMAFSFVSIPQWCDCCCAALETHSTSHQVSIPQWCDCCRFLSIVLSAFSLVSIPQWCDCCRNFSHQVSPNLCVSIPQWCDCCAQAQVTKPKRQVVSIPQWCDCCHFAVSRCCFYRCSFNPTMVRLLHKNGNIMGSPPISFNPTMVRLLHRKD